MKFKACILVASAALSLAAFTTAGAGPEERPATKKEIEKRAVGHTLNGKLKYNKDGSYQYIGGAAGHYTISEGKICVAFNDGGSRCDRITTDGKEYFLINAGGKRFPFG